MLSQNPEFYVDGVLAGDRRILAKTITLVESTREEHQELAMEILDRLMPHTGQAVRLGITGVPGVGKSTFIEAFGMQRIAEGRRLAVLAVDPSSSRSGGSILADKTRMERLSTERNAFIRPSPSGGTLGGVARKTRETMLVCEAAGFDLIIVETVGVGQSETAVAGMVDFFLGLMIAGAGDELQGIKKGVLELADAVVINKADGDNRRAAEVARRQYENALHLLMPASPNWQVPVMTCSAKTGDGLAAVWETVCAHRERLTASRELAAKRRDQALAWMWSLIEEGLRTRFRRHPEVGRQLPRIMREVAAGRLPATQAAQRLLFSLDNTGWVEKG
ncbi:MAG: methylmalonyl Co-A mutase-associated GTPase MeaB [Deltaproteobacteria bacterium]|nr:methylmalonyl Co-A mutase-associated GTPase MeaB [Deltaproteobacteria bacterium]